jgi:hypothetical protein
MMHRQNVEAFNRTFCAGHFDFVLKCFYVSPYYREILITYLNFNYENRDIEIKVFPKSNCETYGTEYYIF